MINNIQLTLIIIVCFCGVSKAQLHTPSLSPSAQTTQTVGLTDIDIKYSRPAVKGRTIFENNGLVPFGEFWRTGANAATKISFSDSVWVNSQGLAKGDYTILTKPGETHWVINFYSYESTRWNSYVDKEPLIAVTINSAMSSEVAESFEISIQNIKTETADLVISWDKTRVRIPLKVEVLNRVMKNIAQTISGPNDFEYFQAGAFMHEQGIDLETALLYVQKSTRSDDALFFQVYKEASILADLGRVTEARAAAKRSIELSIVANNQDYVRLNQKLIAKLSD